jgi:hypothetical protein
MIDTFVIGLLSQQTIPPYLYGGRAYARHILEPGASLSY